MSRAVRISTGFPSAARAAKELRVSKEVAEQLTSLATHSRETGEYAIPGVGRLVRRTQKRRTVTVPAKKIVKFRIAKAAKNAIVEPNKK